VRQAPADDTSPTGVHFPTSLNMSHILHWLGEPVAYPRWAIIILVVNAGVCVLGGLFVVAFTIEAKISDRRMAQFEPVKPLKR
jgi:hypothetical protein